MGCQLSLRNTATTTTEKKGSCVKYELSFVILEVKKTMVLKMAQV